MKDTVAVESSMDGSLKRRRVNTSLSESTSGARLWSNSDVLKSQGVVGLPPSVREKRVLIMKNLESCCDVHGGGFFVKGINATTRAVEKQEVKLVVVFRNVQPKELVAHLPALCQRQKVRITKSFVVFLASP